MSIVSYEHHGVTVKVRSNLKGRHREHCLCFSCEHFKPDASTNCSIASDLFKLCIKYNIVTPVFECPEYEEKKA